MVSTDNKNNISIDNSGMLEFFGELDALELENEAMVVFHAGTLDFKGRFLDLVSEDDCILDNLAWKTGALLLPNWFFTPVILNADILKPYGNKLFQQLFTLLPETVVISSFDEMAGACFFYLTDSPVRSTRFDLPSGGSVDILGINTDNQHNWALLPGSKLKKVYRVIHPFQGEIEVDVSELNRLSKTILVDSLDRFVDQQGVMEYFPDC